MYVFSNRQSKIHVNNCFYAQRIKNKQYVYLLSENAPNCLCYHCSKIGKLYRKERKAVKEYLSKTMDVQCYYYNGQIIIKTAHEEFRIIQSKAKNNLQIYHKNAKIKYNQKSDLPGFHYQGWNFTTILNAVKGAVKHTRHYCERKASFLKSFKQIIKNKQAIIRRKHKIQQKKHHRKNTQKKYPKYNRLAYKKNYIDDYSEILNDYDCIIKL